MNPNAKVGASTAGRFTGMRRELILSILDQGLMSAFNLGLSLTFIALATPEEFGQFVIIQAALFIALAVQGPLVLTPLGVLLPGRELTAQDQQLAMLTSINILIAIGALAVGGATWLLYIEEPLLGMAVCGLYAISVLREYAQSIFFVRGETSRTLLQDGLYVVIAVTTIALLWHSSGALPATILGMGVASLLVSVLVRPAFRFHPASIRKHVADYGLVWTEARWSLLGSMQNEAQTRGYVYITEAWRGASAIGILQAGRLLLAPLSLAVGAWSRVARPAMVASIHHARVPEAMRMLCSGAVGITALSLLYALFLILFWPLLERHVFAERYPDMADIVAVWWIHATLYCLNRCLSTFVQATRQFRILALLYGLSAGSCLAALAVLSMSGFPTIWVLYVLVGSEIAILVGLSWIVLESWTDTVGTGERIGASND